MLNLVVDFQEGKQLALNQKFIEGLRSTLLDSSLDKVCSPNFHTHKNTVIPACLVHNEFTQLRDASFRVGVHCKSDYFAWRR